MIVVFVFLVCAGCSGESNNDENQPPPLPTLPVLSIADNSVVEGDAGETTLTFQVSLTGTATSSVTVSYTTADGTASSASDYVAANGTLTLAVGTSSELINVTVNGDTTVESDENFTVTLSAPTNATISTATATGIITNDDDPVGQIFGLDTRPDNQTCVAPERPDANASVSVIDPFPNLPNIVQPTKMLLEPVINPRWFVLRKTGQLVTFDPDNAISVSTYLDLSGVVRTASEGGLLGMAFHPDYPGTPQIFLSYTIDHTGPAMRSVISRFILDDVVTPGRHGRTGNPSGRSGLR